jgi:hypothetical protein
MKRIAAALFLVLFPVVTCAAETPLTRRDGFLQLWNSVSRPAEPFKTQFDDVPEPAKGSLEIDFAAGRGIIDTEEDDFYPDEPLTLQQALIWLFRTRNAMDDPKEITPDTMTGLLARYPVAFLSDDNKSDTVSEDMLFELMRELDTQLMTEEHEVSLYAEKFHGKGGAFGEQFNMYEMTAAHRSFPHNTLVKVTNIRNDKSVTVRINDRGPYVDGRDMDLSLAAFTAIEDRSKGKFMATFQRLGDVNLVGECSGNSPQQQRLSKNVILDRGVPHRWMLGDTLVLSSQKPFVIRGMTYPDGNSEKFQNFVLPGETYEILPSMEGDYTFRLGTIDGRMREMTMGVVKCE